MSKMGISVISSYRGGCNFETVGLSRTVASEYFPGILSKISGIGLNGIEKKLRTIHKEAFEGTDTVLPIGGIYRYRKNGETHQYQGKLIHLLQSAVSSNSFEAYKKYAEGIYNLPPIHLRDFSSVHLTCLKTQFRNGDGDLYLIGKATRKATRLSYLRRSNAAFSQYDL